MYCKQCGAEIASSAVFCPVCGAKVESGNQRTYDAFTSYSQNNSGPENLENLTIWAFVLSFFQPLIGLILAIISNSHDYGPRNKKFAKAAMIISISLMSLGVIVIFLLFIFVMILANNGGI